MAPGEMNCLAPLAVATTILYLLVQPSSASSPECRWPDKKGEFIDNEILKVFDNLQPKEQHQDDCLFEIPDSDFIHNRSRGEAAAIVFAVYNETLSFYKKKGPRKLLKLLLRRLKQLGRCVTGTAQYKAVTDAICKEYRELRQKAREWGNTTCARSIFWALGNKLQQAVQLSSLMTKMYLMSKTS
uniref:Type I interferon 2.1 n=1 Tax=Xenopus tropicalis TaxID=8364 RepID=A0A219UQH8_XENTR|nr:type I interferon 2.1 [Xenopus tropicalis]